MVRRRAIQALKALLELAMARQEPGGGWRSGTAIATAQQLPAPMLEQVLLQLRRANLVKARRGRLGGYRLAHHPREISLAAVLAAVGGDASSPAGGEPSPGGALPLDALFAGQARGEGPWLEAEDRVLQALQTRLHVAVERELAHLSLEDLLFDLRSWQETLKEGGGLLIG